MKINNRGVLFDCNTCGISGVAHVAPEFICTVCNGQKNYAVICPNCGRKVPVDVREIPENVLTYIKVRPIGIPTYD